MTRRRADPELIHPISLCLELLDQLHRRLHVGAGRESQVLFRSDAQDGDLLPFLPQRVGACADPLSVLGPVRTVYDLHASAEYRRHAAMTLVRRGLQTLARGA